MGLPIEAIKEMDLRAQSLFFLPHSSPLKHGMHCCPTLLLFVCTPPHVDLLPGVLRVMRTFQDQNLR